jgi:RNA polymerase sigma factor (sigma-70 family)
MADDLELTRRFEAHRTHLHGVAYRMLGSVSEAEDALQEAWIRLSRADSSSVENFGGWLTTIVARICLDMLRSRKSRREEPIGEGEGETEPPASSIEPSTDPEKEAELAESVGLALLVVLETLGPAERLAFVLHDMFAMPFEEIAPIVGRTPDAARQLASRARRRVHGGQTVSDVDFGKKRSVVEAYLAALRSGDLQALVAVLDPDVVVRVDAAVSPSGVATESRGAQTWAPAAIAASKGARNARPAVVDGVPGLVVAPRGKLLLAVRFTFTADKISGLEVVADPERLASLEVSLLD